jgi:hypothetical protein
MCSQCKICSAKNNSTGVLHVSLSFWGMNCELHAKQEITIANKIDKAHISFGIVDVFFYYKLGLTLVLHSLTMKTIKEYYILAQREYVFHV